MWWYSEVRGSQRLRLICCLLSVCHGRHYLANQPKAFENSRMTKSVHPWEGICEERKDRENRINIHICIKYINNYNAVTLPNIWIVPCQYRGTGTVTVNPHWAWSKAAMRSGAILLSGLLGTNFLNVRTSNAGLVHVRKYYDMHCNFLNYIPV